VHTDSVIDVNDAPTSGIGEALVATTVTLAVPELTVGLLGSCPPNSKCTNWKSTV
jgi:hypothetical protein